MPNPAFDAAFDLDRICEQWGAPDDAIFLEILGIFGLDGDRLCGQAVTAAREGRFEAAVRAAHTLRGAAANVCAVELANAAGRLEAAVEADEIGVMDSLARTLEAAWAKVRRALIEEGIVSDVA